MKILKLTKYIWYFIPLFAFADESKINNYYIQVNVGQSQSQRVGGDFPLTDVRNSGVYGGEIGYKFNNHFRASLSVDYRNNYRLNNTHLFNNEEEDEEGNIVPSSFKYKYNMKISSLSTMINLYYDILNFHNITPYLVSGIGASYNRVWNVSLATIDDAGTSYSSYSNGYKTNLATKIGVGAKYEINKNFNVGIQYHYINLGTFKTGNIVTYPDKSYDTISPETGRLQSKELMLGIAYIF